jgi:hypothetical protein
MAVESPPSFSWSWPDPGLASLSCATDDPDVYIGVSVGTARIPDWEPVTYSFDAGTFEIGRSDDEWIIAVHGRSQRFERVARFDSRFCEGEVIIAPGATESCSHPLAGPLLDIIVLHRIIDLGGLVVAGTAVLRDGRALAFIGPDNAFRGAPWALAERSTHEGAGCLRTPGRQFALRLQDDVVRVHSLPGLTGQCQVGPSARLEAIHVVSPNGSVFAQAMSQEHATAELLQRVYAPVHDPDCASLLMEAAARITAVVPALKLGLPQENRVVPFAWGKRQAALAFAPPAPG